MSSSESEDLQFKSYTMTSAGVPGDQNSSSFIPEIQQQGQQSNKPVYSLDFYAQFFDVESTQVMRRMFAAIVPKESFFDLISANCDMYGPFWITTTLAFLIFMTDTIGVYLAGTSDQFEYKFGKLGTAALILWGFSFIVPLVFFFIVRSFGYKQQWIELVALFGYGLTIYLPLVLLSFIPSGAITVILTIIGIVVSSVFVIRNAYPLYSHPAADENWGAARSRSSGSLIVLLMTGCFVGIGLVFQLYFFSRTSTLSV